MKINTHNKSEKKIDLYTESCINVFVAGSKELKNERTICRSVCNSLQNQWGTINTKTFEDFPETISKRGHQKDYNSFISNEADIVIFIFSGKIGNITQSEFNHAYNSFEKRNHPKILIYIDKKDSDKKEIIEFKEELSLKGQYYKEYSNIDDLESQVEKHLTKFLINKLKNETCFQKTLKFLGVSAYIVGIWLALSLLGGIGMYIYDLNMSKNDCLNLAIKHLEYERNGELIYNFPDATYIYNLDKKTLDIIERKNELSSVAISLANLEHVTIGATASMLFSRVFKVKVRGNPKVILGYVAAVTAGVLGIGVGCVVEQMFFPPQYSSPVREFLSDTSNWEIIEKKRNPSHWF
ncbi:MAG: hypothetical protein IKJ59_01855 [Clostridia bacterium]|nr:hypothetical protein [Clostridia bacterium]